MVRGFRELRVWQAAMALVREVYVVTRDLPGAEQFGLTSQMRRAAVSVPSNIAEGHGRRSTGDYIRFLGIARGSLCELSTQLEIASRLDFLSPSRTQPLLDQIDALLRQLTTMSDRLELKPRPQASSHPPA